MPKLQANLQSPRFRGKRQAQEQSHFTRSGRRDGSHAPNRFAVPSILRWARTHKKASYFQKREAFELLMSASQSQPAVKG